MRTPNLRLLLLTLGALSTGTRAEQSTEQKLDHARADYRVAVQEHGRNSPEAKNAREHVRKERRSYHSDRRQSAQRKETRRKP